MMKIRRVEPLPKSAISTIRSVDPASEKAKEIMAELERDLARKKKLGGPEGIGPGPRPVLIKTHSDLHPGPESKPIQERLEESCKLRQKVHGAEPALELFKKTHKGFAYDDETRQKFLGRFNEDSETGCWNYHNMEVNVPRFVVARKSQHIHRFSYEAFVGEIPENMTVQRSCNNKYCCRPEHLYLLDRKEIGKVYKKPERKLRFAKLDEHKVREIRNSYKKREDALALAEKFEVSEDTVLSIIERRTWQWVK